MGRSAVVFGHPRRGGGGDERPDAAVGAMELPWARPGWRPSPRGRPGARAYSGRRMTKRLPWPGRESTVNVPPWLVVMMK